MKKDVNFKPFKQEASEIPRNPIKRTSTRTFSFDTVTLYVYKHELKKRGLNMSAELSDMMALYLKQAYDVDVNDPIVRQNAVVDYHTDQFHVLVNSLYRHYRSNDQDVRQNKDIKPRDAAAAKEIMSQALDEYQSIPTPTNLDKAYLQDLNYAKTYFDIKM